MKSTNRGKHNAKTFNKSLSYENFCYDEAGSDAIKSSMNT